MSGVRSPAASLAVAMAKGFWRDRAAVFFAVVFPLMFLLLFGTLSSDEGASRTSVVQVGEVPLLDDPPGMASQVVDNSLDITRADDLDAALDEIREGDLDAAVVQDGDTVQLYYSQADPVVAGTVQGTFQAVISSANLGASQRPPQFTLQADAVEDEALSAVQYLTPPDRGSSSAERVGQQGGEPRAPGRVRAVGDRLGQREPGLVHDRQVAPGLGRGADQHRAGDRPGRLRR